VSVFFIAIPPDVFLTDQASAGGVPFQQRGFEGQPERNRRAHAEAFAPRARNYTDTYLIV
jgi:hypothetical protein